MLLLVQLSKVPLQGLLPNTIKPLHDPARLVAACNRCCNHSRSSPAIILLIMRASGYCGHASTWHCASSYGVSTCIANCP